MVGDGWIFFYDSFAASFIFLLNIDYWKKTYLVPFGTYFKATCDILNSTQSSVPNGYMREPLYRAEVCVYVFNTKYTDLLGIGQMC
jgi:hypothetical protein